MHRVLFSPLGGAFFRFLAEERRAREEHEREEKARRVQDTYFKVARGRLKLREQDTSAELIYYERSDQAIERESKYRIIPIDDPDALKDSLSAALGVLVAVEKSRRLLIWRNVRIHLDEVPGLGSFVELEAVAEPDSDLSGEYRNVRELREALGITDEQILAAGYSDALLRVGAAEGVG